MYSDLGYTTKAKKKKKFRIGGGSKRHTFLGDAFHEPKRAFCNNNLVMKTGCTDLLKVKRIFPASEEKFTKNNHRR